MITLDPVLGLLRPTLLRLPVQCATTSDHCPYEKEAVAPVARITDIQWTMKRIASQSAVGLPVRHRATKEQWCQTKLAYLECNYFKDVDEK